MYFVRRWWSDDILTTESSQLRNKLNISMTGCSSVESIGEILSLISGSRHTIGRFMISVGDIWIFEFEGDVRIISGVEGFTNSESIIMSSLIKVLISQVDNWYCKVTTTYI